jgi:glucose/arabinose dehydrogenase
VTVCGTTLEGVAVRARRTRPPAPRLLLALVLLALVAGGPAAFAADPAGVAANPVAAPPGDSEAALRPPGVASDGEVTPTAFVPGNIHLTFARIARGLSRPVFITHSGDNNGRLFVVEQTGKIRVIRKGTLLATPFLDLRSKITYGGERGLLGLAFHPDYSWNRKFYVYYVDRNNDTVVEQYLRSTSNASVAEPNGKFVLRIQQPSFTNHKGGMLAFGPDRYLYIATGDGGGTGDPGNRAQNKNSLLGKILRINIDTNGSYTIPPTNPYVGRNGSDLVWSFGLRNPWRFSFDRQNGNLWIGDVGQEKYEEINRSRGDTPGRGSNYGWRVMEAGHCYNPPTGCNTSGKVLPITTYGHSQGCSVTGGYVYRGSAYPDLRGAYVFGDFCSGRIWGIDNAGPAAQAPVLLFDTATNLSSFGEDQAGNIYIVDINGEIWMMKDL